MDLYKFKEKSIRDNGGTFFPQEGSYYLTYRCNLSCRYCFQRSQYEKGYSTYKELTFEEIEKAFGEYSFKSFFITGGEPFLREDISRIIRFFRDRSERLSVFTNGTLLNEDHIGLMNERNVKAWISLDGIGAVHNANRGENTFDKVINTVSRLKSENVFLNTVITEENIDHLYEFYQYVKTLGVQMITFQFPMLYDRDNHFLDKYGFSYFPGSDFGGDLSYIRKLWDLKELIEKDNRGNCMNVRFYPSMFMENIEDYIGGTIREKHVLSCQDLVKPVIKIMPDGEVVLCECFDIRICNLLTDNLSESWNSERIRNIRKKILTNNLTEMCSRCCSLQIYVP